MIHNKQIDMLQSLELEGRVNAGKQTFLSIQVTDAWQVDPIFMLRCSKFPPRRRWWSVSVHNEQKCLPLRTLTSVYFDMRQPKQGVGLLAWKTTVHCRRYRAVVLLYLHKVHLKWKIHRTVADWLKKCAHTRQHFYFIFGLRNHSPYKISHTCLQRYDHSPYKISRT
jgi:hypothetical protein